MPTRKAITADAGLAQAKKSSAVFKPLLQQGHEHEASIREDHYKGHRITIRTTYEIEIDGRPFHGTLDVSNAGNVQYHGLPNVSANSAIELMRSVIDTFPDDFTATAGGHSHGGHGTESSAAVPTRRTMKRVPKKTSRTSAAKDKHARTRKHSH